MRRKSNISPAIQSCQASADFVDQSLEDITANCVVQFQSGRSLIEVPQRPGLLKRPGLWFCRGGTHDSLEQSTGSSNLLMSRIAVGDSVSRQAETWVNTKPAAQDSGAAADLSVFSGVRRQCRTSMDL